MESGTLYQIHVAPKSLINNTNKVFQAQVHGYIYYIKLFKMNASML